MEVFDASVLGWDWREERRLQRLDNQALGGDR
jgi:hypothetical protein